MRSASPGPHHLIRRVSPSTRARNTRRAWGAVVAVVGLCTASLLTPAAGHASPSAVDHGLRDGESRVEIGIPTAALTSIGGGNEHSVARDADGKALAWGYNGYGQLGNDTISNSRSPVPVSAPSGVTFSDLAAGYNHSLALGDDGKVYAWGQNTAGQLGNGQTAHSRTPVRVSMPSTADIIAIAGGESHSAAVSDDGNAYTWGYNTYGQLGNETITNSRTPVPVSKPAGVAFTYVDAGTNHTVALGDDGNAYAWGRNNNGQLGASGSATSSRSPMRVAQPAGVTFTAVSAGYDHTVALGDDGNAYTWGYNAYGQLGNGTITNSRTPVPVSKPAGVTFTHLDAGNNHTVALGDDGTAYAWGANTSGQLGNGSTARSTTPVPVSTVPGVLFTAIAGGSDHTLALGDDGAAYAWGRNNNGQLGSGSTATSSSKPVRVLTSRTFTLLAPNLAESNAFPNGTEFSGTGEPKTGVVLIAGDESVVGETVVGEQGTWSVPLAALPVGPNTLTIVATLPDGGTFQKGPFDIEITEPGPGSAPSVSVTIRGTTEGWQTFEVISTLTKDGEYYAPSGAHERVTTAPDYSFEYPREWDLKPGTYESLTVLTAAGIPVGAEGLSCDVRDNDGLPIAHTLRTGPISPLQNPNTAWCTFTVE